MLDWILAPGSEVEIATMFRSVTGKLDKLTSSSNRSSTRKRSPSARQPLPTGRESKD